MMSKKDAKELTADMFIYGTSCRKYGVRKWYNPLRYIVGTVYIKRIDPKKIYKEPL